MNPVAKPRATSTGTHEDVRKPVANRGLIRPHVDLADPGIIDEDAALGQEDQLPCRGAMPASTGHFIHLVCPLVIVTEQLIHDRGLPHAARSDQRHRDALFEVGFQDR